jgi:hypothetical protein
MGGKGGGRYWSRLERHQGTSRKGP